MSKKGEFRQFHVNFWQATAVEDLDPTEKLLYIYFITSPRSNMEGVYKTTLRRIAFETGIDRDMVVKIAGRFASLGIGGIARDRSSDVWVIVSHSPEFMTASPSIQTYFAENIGKVPVEVVKFMNCVGYKWPKWAEKPTDEVSEVQGVHTPYTPPIQGVYTVGTHVSDTDTDTKTNTDTNTLATADAPAPRGGLSPLKDELANQYQDAFTSETPAGAWGNIGRERKALNDIAQRTRRLSAETGIEPGQLAAMILTEFSRMKRTERASFWKTASFTPSSLAESNRWNAVVESLKHAAEVEEVAVF